MPHQLTTYAVSALRARPSDGCAAGVREVDGGGAGTRGLRVDGPSPVVAAASRPAPTELAEAAECRTGRRPKRLTTALPTPRGA